MGVSAFPELKNLNCGMSTNQRLSFGLLTCSIMQSVSGVQNQYGEEPDRSPPKLYIFLISIRTINKRSCNFIFSLLGLMKGNIKLGHRNTADGVRHSDAALQQTVKLSVLTDSLNDVITPRHGDVITLCRALQNKST